jgi:hypothetical protein
MQQPQQSTQQEPMLKFDLSASMVNTILVALQNVDAPHRVTDPVIKAIFEQAQAQTGDGSVEKQLPSSLN